MPTERIYKLSYLCLALAVVLLPGVIYYAVNLRFGTTFVEKWLPGEDSARASYREFREEFGDDQFLIVAWPTCTLEDYRQHEFTERLEELQESQPELGILGVNNAARWVDELVARGIEREDAIERLRGFMIGPTGVCILMLKLEQAPVEVRARLMDEIQTIAQDLLKFEAKLLVLAGEPFQIYMIDRTSREAMERLVLPSSLLSLLVAWFCVRSFRLTALIFLFAGLGQVLGMATVSFFLEEMIAVLVVLPTLVFMLTLSAAVHLTNYLKDCRVLGCKDSGLPPNPDAGAHALRMGLWPCLLATLTTAFGLGSLSFSQLSPVWQFGLLSAFGLILSSAITITTFPAVTRLLSSRRGQTEDSGSETPSCTKSNSEAIDQFLSEQHAGWASNFLSHWTARLATPVSLLGLALLGFASLGLTRLQTSTEFEDMFATDSVAVKNLRWVRNYVGPINSLEFLVTLKADSALTFDSEAHELQSQVAALGKFDRALEESEVVHSTISAMTLLPSPPDVVGMRGTIQRAMYRSKLLNNLPLMIREGLVAENETTGSRTWRITARIADLRGDNYAEKRDQLLEGLEQELARMAPEVPYAFDYEVTGLRTVVEKAHYALITDLIQSFMAAFVLITPVMMLIVRGVGSGIFLMIPNVLPVAFVFGCMGWLGIKLDVASILTASVALGIAVDDTLHFVTWYFRGRRRDLDAQQATKCAIRACAKPMLHTTIICSAAMFPFFFSEFTPTSKFALLMILILSGAILGDLILLPALLQSPLGNWIGRNKGKPRLRIKDVHGGA